MPEKKISIKKQIFKLIGIPSILLILLSFLFARDSFNTYFTAKNDEQLIIYIEALSKLQHELQKERGISNGFIGSEDSTWILLLTKQYPLSDYYKTNFQNIIKDNLVLSNNSFKHKYSLLNSHLDQQTIIRHNVLNQTIPSKKVLQFYTEINDAINQLIFTSKNQIQDNKTKYLLNEFSSILKFKEEAGIELAILSHVFTKNKFENGDYEKIFVLRAYQKNFLTNFSNIFDHEFNISSKNTLQDTNIITVNKIVDEVIRRHNMMLQTQRLSTHLSYGGLIHYFKNHILRGKASNQYKELFLNTYHEFKKEITHIKTSKFCSEDDIRHLNIITNVFEEYFHKIPIIDALHAQNRKIDYIDKKVKVDDSHAFSAITVLNSNQAIIHDPIKWFKLATIKIDLYFSFANIYHQNAKEQIKSNYNKALLLMLSSSLLFLSICIFIYYASKKLTAQILNPIIELANKTIKIGETDKLQFKNEELEEINQLSIALKDATYTFQLNRKILESIPMPMDIVDLSGTVLFQNKIFKNIVKEDFNGKKCYEIYRDNQEQCNDCPLKKSIITTKTIETSKILNGKTFKITHTPVHYNNQDALLEVFVDITQSKNIQQLIIEKKSIEKSAKIKESFLANMSHEIRTPMNGIIGMIDLLIKTTSLDKVQKDYIETIQSSSMDLLTLLNEILDLSKLEAGKMELVTSKINYDLFIKNTVGLFSAIAFKKNLKLIIQKPASIPKLIEADKTKLKQITSNLIGNALKFTTKGEIIVKSSIVSKDENKLKLKIEIIDTGCGISIDDQDRLFNPFQQLDESYTKMIKGTGLGLSISKRLVELMNGDIGVISDLGKGSNFWFTFTTNKVEDNDLDISKKDILLENVKFKLNVLLADDKIVNQKVAQLMLENLSCTIDIVNNGKEAIEKFKEGKYDLIFMDIQMPEMDGIETTKFIKKNYKMVPPIIGLSANAMEGDSKRYMSQGLDDYLLKPLTLETLINKLLKWFKPNETSSERSE